MAQLDRGPNGQGSKSTNPRRQSRYEWTTKWGQVRLATIQEAARELAQNAHTEP